MLETPIYRIVAAQFIATFVAATLCLIVDWATAYSAMLGGLTCAVPNALLAWRLGRGADPKGALKSLVRGELGKLVMTAVIFAAVFFWVKPLEVMVYFVALILVMLFNMLVPLIEAKKTMAARERQLVKDSS